MNETDFVREIESLKKSVAEGRERVVKLEMKVLIIKLAALASLVWSPHILGAMSKVML